MAEQGNQKSATTTHQFQAEISQLLSLIISAVYTNKDVAIRELISNASDALDKLRHLNLTKTPPISDYPYEVTIVPDKEKKLLIISDNGIGMTKYDLIHNLGTIAKSGTKEFLEKLAGGKAEENLIGRFGVGFYSSFLIADRVRVITKHQDDLLYTWESTAGGSFDITVGGEYPLEQGTKVIIHLKDGTEDYLKESKIKEIVKRHSQFITHPIYLQVEKTRDKEITDDEAEPEEIKEQVQAIEDDEKNEDEVKVEESKEPKKKMKKIQEKYFEMEHINKTRPIWTKNPEDVTKEEYVDMYKNLSNDWEDYLAVKHFSCEGQLEFRCILFIPKRAPFDMFQSHNQKAKSKVKLYVRKVFITDDCAELMPQYLNLVVGIVDSEDLPLNISRETLQQSKIIKVIRKNIVKKVIETIKDIYENADTRKTFYEQFSKNLKLGVHEDSEYRKDLLQFLMYKTSNSNDEFISLKDYVTRMKENQTNIYYITGEDIETVSKSPFLERLKKLGYEVLYMVEPIDDYMMGVVKEFEGKKFFNISKEKLEFKEDSELTKEQIEQRDKEFEPLCQYFKKAMGDKIQKCIVSSRLVTSPCCIVTDEHGMDANMERILKAQALRDSNYGFGAMGSKKSLEINPNHKTIKFMLDRIVKDENDPIVKNLVPLLCDCALMESGFNPSDRRSFTARVNNMIQMGLGLEVDEIHHDEVSNGSTEQQIDTNNPADDLKMEEVD